MSRLNVMEVPDIAAWAKPDELLLTTGYALRQELDTEMDVAESACLLHFHYNTLRYRIARIEALLGPFTTDAQLRLRILLALQVLEMRGV